MEDLKLPIPFIFLKIRWIPCNLVPWHEIIRIEYKIYTYWEPITKLKLFNYYSYKSLWESANLELLSLKKTFSVILITILKHSNPELSNLEEPCRLPRLISNLYKFHCHNTMLSIRDLNMVNSLKSSIENLKSFILLVSSINLNLQWKMLKYSNNFKCGCQW